MADQMKLAKRLRMFKQCDEATLVAAISTSTLDHRALKAPNDGMEHLYNICKDIQDQSSINGTHRDNSTSTQANQRR